MAHDASGSVDGDCLLWNWLLARGFDWCEPRSWSVCVGASGEKVVQKGPSLGGGEGRWCSVGVGVRGRYYHVERIQMRVGCWTVGGGGRREGLELGQGVFYQVL